MRINFYNKIKKLPAVCAARISLILASGVMFAALSGCGGGSGFAQPDGQSSLFTIGGTVSGLSGTGLVLQNNGTDNLAQTADGDFTFATKIARNGSYAVTVLTQPVGQICTVNNGTGSNITSNVTNVSVNCSALTYTVSGTVTGLITGQQITIKNNGANPTNVTSNTSFTFSTPIAYGSNYAVTVDTQPVTQTCTVTNGSMTNVTANVTNVVISCSTPTFQVLYSYGTITNDAITPTYGRLVQASDGNFYGATMGGGEFNEGAAFMITPLGVETVTHSFDSSGARSPSVISLAIGPDGDFYSVSTSGGFDSCGTVFKVTSTGTATVLHNFNSTTTDGCSPTSGLTLGSDGNFYGTTGGAGAFNGGTVFKITPSGTETLVYSFGNGLDGSSPFNANLVQASDGNFYGVTNGGGDNGLGTVYKLTPSGTETVLYSFAGGTTDGSSPQSGLTIGPDGNFYGTTLEGGASNLGTVFKITPTGTETVIHSFAGGAADGAQPSGSDLVLGPDNNFYSMTSAGGASDNGVLYKITPGGAVTLLHTFSGGATDGAVPFTGITIGTDGYLYGTTSEGGAFSEGVFFRY